MTDQKCVADCDGEKLAGPAAQVVLVSEVSPVLCALARTLEADSNLQGIKLPDGGEIPKDHVLAVLHASGLIAERCLEFELDSVICRGCGCRERDPCDDELMGTCGWATDNLCTTCRNKQLAADGKPRGKGYTTLCEECGEEVPQEDVDFDGVCSDCVAREEDDGPEFPDNHHGGGQGV